MHASTHSVTRQTEYAKNNNICRGIGYCMGWPIHSIWKALRLTTLKFVSVFKTPNISERNPKCNLSTAVATGVLFFVVGVFLTPWHLIGRFRASILFLATIFQWILHKLLNMCENWTQPHIHTLMHCLSTSHNWCFDSHFNVTDTKMYSMWCVQCIDANTSILFTFCLPFYPNSIHL